MNEIAPGVWHWTARHPKIGMDVSSYFLLGPAVLLDPLAPPEGLERLEQLGPPREILLTNRHHYRGSDELVERFGCTVRAPRLGMHEFTNREPVEPYDFGETLAGGAVAVHEVGGICPDESALHVPAASALAVADGASTTAGCASSPTPTWTIPRPTRPHSGGHTPGSPMSSSSITC